MDNKEAVKRLALARKAYKYSQLETARLLDIPLIHYREIERAERALTTHQARILTDMFCVNLTALTKEDKK